MNLPRQIIEHGPYVILGQPFAVVDTKYPDVAAEIARRWNAHDPLRDALRGMLEWARRVRVPNPGLEILAAHNALNTADKGDPYDDPEADANARLIAAASDLLDFARRVVSDAGATVRKGANGMPELCGGLDPAILLDEFLRHGRKAIARATGGGK